MQTLKKLTPVTLSCIPLLALAATTLQDVIENIKDVLETLIPLLMIVATVVFLWGVIRFITAGGDEDKIREGRSLIIWGLIGLFVMVAVWGIVEILGQTLGIEEETIPEGPQF